MAHPIFTKELPEAPPVALELSVRTEGANVIVEPAPVHGVCGFTMILSGDGAKSLGHMLISAATRLLPPTTH